jgi:hypothetical protein
VGDLYKSGSDAFLDGKAVGLMEMDFQASDGPRQCPSDRRYYFPASLRTGTGGIDPSKDQGKGQPYRNDETEIVEMSNCGLTSQPVRKPEVATVK